MSKKKLVRYWNASDPECFRKICRQEFTANYSEYTKNQFPTHSYNPPADQIRGKIRDLEVFWGRMNTSAYKDCFTVDLYNRVSASEFGKGFGITSFTKKELGDIRPQQGDCFWIWAWKEERIKFGIVERLHIEVESRILTEVEISQLREIIENSFAFKREVHG